MRILAVGNEACGDDGVGAAVLATIRSEGLLPGAELVDAGLDPLALVDRLAPDELNVVVDAARMGEAPGTVRRFTPDQLRLRPWRDRLSAHGIGLPEALALAEVVGSLPERLVIIGVEPERTEIGQGLSPAVAGAVPEVIAIIAAEVDGHAADHPGHRR
jgi:hydrogenase maturation protease